jgi:hypothetical protein
VVEKLVNKAKDAVSKVIPFVGILLKVLDFIEPDEEEKKEPTV